MDTPTATIEAWFTGADAGTLNHVAEALAVHGSTVATAPWPFNGAGPTPALAFSLVLDVPAGLDPTLVAALAEEHSCRYHAGGPSERWVDSPVTRTATPTRVQTRVQVQSSVTRAQAARPASEVRGATRSLLQRLAGLLRQRH